MSKYKNVKTRIDGYTFDSKREAERYKELRLLERAGAIRDLCLQPEFELIPAFIDGQCKRHRATKYIADFAYFETDRRDNKRIIEDVKGIETQAFKIKMKLLLYKYADIVFRIVK